ncbi:MAG: alpha/beta fold hydrolase [Rhodomicrobium sp.]
MRHFFLFGWIVALAAVLGSCATYVATHESEVQLRTVNTPTGPLRLAAIEMGHGRPILLLHGFATSSYTWHSIIPELAKDHRVIAIDLRGFGASDKPLDEHYSIQDQTEAVQAFIEQENLRDLTVIGHSFGGGITLSLALNAEQQRKPRIRNIVLIDTIAYRQPLPIFFKLLQIPMVGDLGMTLVPPEIQAEQGLRVAYYDRDKISGQDIAEYASTLYSPAAKHALTKTIEQMVPDNIDELALRYRTIKMPALILWCEQDKVVPVVLGERLHDNMGSSELAIFTHCGHMPQEEKPQDTVAAIQAFLKRNAS